MKKIAIVVNNSWYAWNMRANLGFAFQKQGYEVVFISPYDKYSENIKEHFRYIDININSKGTNPIEDLKQSYINLFEMVKEKEYKNIVSVSLGTGVHGYKHNEIAKVFIPLI